MLCWLQINTKFSRSVMPTLPPDEQDELDTVRYRFEVEQNGYGTYKVELWDSQYDETATAYNKDLKQATVEAMQALHEQCNGGLAEIIVAGLLQKKLQPKTNKQPA